MGLGGQDSWDCATFYESRFQMVSGCSYPDAKHGAGIFMNIFMNTCHALTGPCIQYLPAELGHDNETYTEI